MKKRKTTEFGEVCKTIPLRFGVHLPWGLCRIALGFLREELEASHRSWLSNKRSVRAERRLEEAAALVILTLVRLSPSPLREARPEQPPDCKRGSGGRPPNPLNPPREAKGSL